MRLSQVLPILNAEVLCGTDWLNREAETVCGSDLLSDVLAFTKEKTLLLTGLTNIQVIRTAEVSDLVGIVFVGGKRPAVDLITMAQAKRIPLLVTKFSMYEACGLLYQSGLKGCI